MRRYGITKEDNGRLRLQDLKAVDKK